MTTIPAEAKISEAFEETSVKNLKFYPKSLAKMYSISAITGPSHPNHHIVMNNSTPRRIRHDFTIYNTDITHLIPTTVNLQ